MNKKIFFILEGNNGASYIFNIKDAESIVESLKFYKARTFKQKVMKNALKLYLNIIGFLCRVYSLCTLLDKSNIEQYLEKLTNLSIDFELDENCSILISPTRDKIIVHHHGDCFHKFAFGDSYANVKNEAKIYALLNRALQNFKVSKFYDLNDSQNKFCSFKLGSQLQDAKSDINLTLALIEMFNISRQDKQTFSSYLEELKNRYLKSSIKCETVVEVLEEMEETHENKLIPLGLVHRDFKPWNINTENSLLIYDFEEAVLNGPPLEDFFNYYIDPIIQYISPSEIIKKIYLLKNINEYKFYLNELDIDIEFEILLYCYLIERILSYQASKDITIRKNYILLLKNILIMKGYK
jgi:hypothetical protein